MNTLKEIGEKFNIPVVKTFPGSAISMQDLIAKTRDSEGIEGWIIRFSDGHMLKVKSSWYILMHKSKDIITYEKNIINLLVNGKIDDIKSFVFEEDRRRIENFETKFWQGVADTVDRYDNYWLEVQKAGLDRKSYAVNWMPKIKDTDSFAPTFIFGKFSGNNSREMVIDSIRRSTGSAAKIELTRNLWGNLKWNYETSLDE